MKLVNQNVLDGRSQANLSNLGNVSINNAGNSNDPNKNLIQEDSWQRNLNILEDQNRFLQIKQENFMNFDLWDSNNHEVRNIINLYLFFDYKTL